MSAVPRDIAEIEVFLSPGFRGLNDARARIWRLNTELAHTESGISFMNVTTYKYTKSTYIVRVPYIGCPGAGKHLLRTRKQEPKLRDRATWKRRVWIKIYTLKSICKGFRSDCRIAGGITSSVVQPENL